MSFYGLKGQEEIIRTLQVHLSSGKVPHAYLFTGPAGSGRSTTARILALSLLCLQPDGTKACGTCPSCKMMQQGTHPDFFAVGTKEDPILDEDAREIDVDRIRKLIAAMQEKPLISSRRFCLMAGAERMNKQAQNCLLKLFEEPPENSVITLISTGQPALLDTVVSRALILEFKRLPVHLMEELLRPEANGDENLLMTAIAYADGIPGKGFAFLKQQDLHDVRDLAFKLWTDLVKGDPREMVNQSRSLEKLGKEKKQTLEALLDALAVICRDAMVYAGMQDDSLLINRDKKDMIIKYLPKIRPASMARAVERTEKARHELGLQGSTPLVMEMLLADLKTLLSSSGKTASGYG